MAFIPYQCRGAFISPLYFFSLFLSRIRSNFLAGPCGFRFGCRTAEGSGDDATCQPGWTEWILLETEPHRGTSVAGGRGGLFCHGLLRLAQIRKAILDHGTQPRTAVKKGTRNERDGNGFMHSQNGTHLGPTCHETTASAAADGSLI